MEETINKVPKKKQLLIRDGLFTIPASAADEPHLIGGECGNCREVVFPKQPVCPNCQSNNIKEKLIGPRGKLYSFTNVNHPVPEAYKGPIPYGVGIIELPEGVRVISHLTESDPDKLKADMDMVLIIDQLFEDEEGNEVTGYKFKPA
ncbi:Zn-ribbon domain-containing OB-fold protein [Chloroflexota bacterium]